MLSGLRSFVKAFTILIGDISIKIKVNIVNYFYHNISVFSCFLICKLCKVYKVSSSSDSFILLVYIYIFFQF